MKLHLPRYVIARERKDKVAFYYSVPERLRPSTWSDTVIRLPDDLQDMYKHANILNAKLDAERSGSPLVTFSDGSIPMIVRKYQNSSKFKNLSPNTQRLYVQTLNHLIEWSKKSGHPHIRKLTRPVILKFLERFSNRPTLRKKIGGIIRLICAYAIDLGELDVNPALSLRLTENRKEPYIFTDEDVLNLVATAEKMGHTAIATAVLIAVNIGQRKGDILKMKAGVHYKDSMFSFTQNKTGEIMKFPATEELKQRLSSVTEGYLIGKYYSVDRFSHVFEIVRDAAGILSNAKFMHFRHTACVRLARAGCTVPEIASISGHSAQSVHAILRRYLPRDETVAKNAIQKLEEYEKNRRSTAPLKA